MINENIKIKFAGGSNTPTGSNFLLEYGDKKILIDCGLYQGEKIISDNNYEDFSYNPKDIDYLFVTHGHLDHVGRIPKLTKEGFVGKIYSTEPTRDIGELIMMDSLNIIEKEAERYGKTAFFEERDVLRAMLYWNTLRYGQELIIDAGDNKKISVKLYDSGHILGSAIIKFEIEGKRIAFTGDLGNSPSPLLNDTQNMEGVDYLILESVYGNRNHESKNESVMRFKNIIKKSIKNQGTILIPAFSIERTQELLFYLNDMIEHNDIPHIPVYLDSPLAIKITDIYKKYRKYLNKSANAIIDGGDDIFRFPNLYQTLTKEESKTINTVEGAKIIIAGSGMSSGGRIVHHEKHYLGYKNTDLILVGYQAVGSLGRLLQDGVKNIKIQNEDITVRANIENIGGFSAHKDSDHLLEFVINNSKDIKKIFVVLGEPKSAMFLSQRIQENTNIETYIPSEDEVVEI